MAEVKSINTSKRKKPLDIDWTMLFTAADSVGDHLLDHAIPKSKDRIGVVQEPETEVEDLEYQMKTDGELEEKITRMKKTLLTVGHKFTDKGEKLKATIRRCVAEVNRRKRNPVDKNEREEEDDVKRMRRLRDELEAEKKQGIEVKGKLVDAETKIIQLKAHIYDLQEKLRGSSLQLDAVEEEKKELAKRLNVSERKCDSLVDDSKWLLKEGLPFLVQKLLNESSKENFMTVSELRTLHQRFRSNSS